METERRHGEDHHEKRIRELHRFAIDGKSYYLPRGYYLVKSLKEIAQVPACHVLAEIRDCNVDDLTDDTATHIEGGEVFKSYPGKGENS